jgi:hypothetical protein
VTPGRSPKIDSAKGMYNASMCLVCKVAYLRKAPRQLPPTGRASTPEATPLSHSQRRNRRSSMRCRRRCLTSPRTPDPARLLLPRQIFPARLLLSPPRTPQELAPALLAPAPQLLCLPAASFSVPLCYSRRSRVRRDVHGRLSTEEQRIDNFGLGCDGEDPKPDPRSRFQGSGCSCSRSWWRPWCWVTTAWSASDDPPGEDTIHHGWLRRWRPKLVGAHGRILFSS